MKRLLTGILAILVLVLLLLLLVRWRTQDPPQPRPELPATGAAPATPPPASAVVSVDAPAGTALVAESGLSAVAAGGKMPPPPTAAAVPRPIPTLLAGVEPSPSQMVFLIFELAQGTLKLHEARRVNARLPMPDSVPLETGIYHRLLSRDNRVLAQGFTRDPAIVYHDEPRADGSGLLEGGWVRLESVSFDVRYPVIAGAQRIELYRVDATSEIETLSQEAPEYYGSFDLP